MNRVLVVDDKQDNLYYLQALLSGHGWTVELATNGAEALKMAQTAPPDMVVSDLFMPVMDGYTLLRNWKADERLRHVPFIVYTATYTESEDQRLALDLGADAFILKPAEPDIFIARINEVRASSVASPTATRNASADATSLLKMYSETLIRKLEDKTRQLEHLNRQLQQDLIERNSMATALAQSEADFRTLIETMPQIVWMTMPDGHHIRFNQQWFDFTGLTLEQSIGKGWNPAFHPDDQARAATRWQESLESGKPYEVEYRLRRADGTYRWMLGRALPLRDADGTISKWFGTCTDIQQLKQAEETALQSEQVQRELATELQVERARLEAAQMVAGIGSWETELDTMNVIWSAQTYRIFDVDENFRPTHAGFIGRVHADDREKVETSFTQSLGQQTTNSIEHRIVTEKGKLKYLEECWHIVYDDKGKAVRAVGTCQDITERRELQEQLQQSQRLESVGQLTGGIAHDFNNLLTVILGNAELIAEQLGPESSLRVLAEMISSAAQRGADLTQRLLAFARKQVLAPQVVDVNVLVRGMTPLLQRTLGEHIVVEFHAEAGLRQALVDPSQLESALLNLCLNSRDAMPGGGKLIIEADNEILDDDYTSHYPGLVAGEYIMLAVSDTGTGIQPEILPRLFEPFFTTKEKGKGTGLGLPMVYGFVKQSGGHVNIYSEVGHGTTVKLYLPISDKTAKVITQQQSEAMLTNGGETILLVEDDALVREYAHGQLESLGYKVLVAENGVQALETLTSYLERIDLLFTDMIMPGGMNGKQLAEQAVSLRTELKVLYTSGYTEDAIVFHGRLETGVQLLGKPYRRQELATAIRQAIDVRITEHD